MKRNVPENRKNDVRKEIFSDTKDTHNIDYVLLALI